ncbi:MAG: Beta-lactamase [Enterovirga sp.]|nr:Beta-lactamase [Enterovirga sp.]
MCGTFKVLAGAFVLARADRGDEDLERRILFSERDLVPPYSSVTRDRVHGGGMSLAELCEAAVGLSDNTAANLVLASFGGPAALTGFTRSLGDDTTRFDRTLPELNEGAANDPRDTTSPAAMLEAMRKILLNDVLAPHSRERLIAWMQKSPTGDGSLGAGLPKDWRVAGTTGSGGNGSAAHVAVVWRIGEVPLLIAAYMTGSKASPARLNEAFAEIGRLVTAWLR